MIYRKIFLIMLIVISLLLISIGCNNNAQPESESEITEGIITQVEVNDTKADDAEEKETIIVNARQGNDDRLPGSLKFTSVAMYKDGKDFYADYDEGLNAVRGYRIESEDTGAGTSYAETTEAADIKPSEKDDTKQSDDSDTSSGETVRVKINSNVGGVTTQGTFEGDTFKHEHNVTIGNGSSDSTPWYNAD